MENSKNIALTNGASLSDTSLSQLASTMSSLLCATSNSSTNAATLGSKLNSFMYNMAKSSVGSAACGETSYSSSDENFGVSLGKGSPTTSNFGIFGFKSLNTSNADASGCPPFVSGQTNSKLFKSSKGTIGSKVYKMSFLNSGNMDITTPSKADVVFDIPVPSASLSSNNATCAFVKYANSSEIVDGASTDTTGCITVGTFDVNGEKVIRCSCSHLTDFLVTLDPIPSPSPSPTPAAAAAAGANVGMIVGIVIGVLVAVGLVGGFVYMRSRRGPTSYARDTSLERGQAAVMSSAVAASNQPDPSSLPRYQNESQVEEGEKKKKKKKKRSSSASRY
jgi:hypothetical protein